MTKTTGKYRYTNERGEELHKRANFSTLKLTLLKSLCKMDRNDVKATAYDNKFQDRYYDVVTIARDVYSDTVFTGGKLSESIRTSLNRSLKALYWDGFLEYTGNSHINIKTMRDFVKNHWRVSAEGKRVLAADYNGYLTSYMAKNRYVGNTGAYPISAVKKELWSDYWEAE